MNADIARASGAEPHPESEAESKTRSDPELPQLAIRINAAHRRAEEAVGQMLWDAREAGELLVKVKSSLKHGEFTRWINEHCRFGERTARVYMRIAQRWEDLPQGKDGSALPVSLAKARRLLQEPKAESAPSSPARAALSRHVRRIWCGGNINEAVFFGAFETAAMTSDHLLLVLAPPLEGAPELSEPLGLVDLGGLIKVCSWPGNERETLDQLVERVSDRLVIHDGDGRQVRLLTAEPRVIASTVDASVVEAIIPKVGNHEVPLSAGLTSKVRAVSRALKAKHMLVEVGKEGGAIIVGDEGGPEARLSVPQLRADEAYELMFQKHMIDVLSSIHEPDAVMRLAGPGSVVAIEDGKYRYLLSPIGRGTEHGAPAPRPTEEARVSLWLDIPTQARLRRVMKVEGVYSYDGALARVLRTWEGAHDLSREDESVVIEGEP